MIFEFNNQTSVRIPKAYVTIFLKKTLTQLKSRGVVLPSSSDTLYLVFINPRSARQLNSAFRRKDYATDVLSFSGVEPSSLGELVFCPQVLKRQSLAHGLSFRDELCYMVLHGLLHLLGYDHEKSQREAKRMFALQDQIFDHVLKSM
jgi:probable rRNA maturation factor